MPLMFFMPSSPSSGHLPVCMSANTRRDYIRWARHVNAAAAGRRRKLIVDHRHLTCLG
jgi:hypothetical protein